MSVYLKIKEHQLESRKMRREVETKVLTMLLSEADSIQILRLKDDLQDDAMLSIVLKYEKNLLKNISTFANNKIFVEELRKELEVIQPYLPKKLTKEDLSEIHANDHYGTFAEFMKHLSSNHKGKYDSKLVKEFWDELHD